MQYPPVPPEEQIKHLLDDEHINYGFLESVYKKHDGFQQQYPNVRTWREVREALTEGNFFGDGNADDFAKRQLQYTWNHLGIPVDGTLTAAEEKRLCARIRSSNPKFSHTFEALGSRAVNTDLIIVRTGDQKNSTANAAAAMHVGYNVMELCPSFYENEEMSHISLRDVTIVPGQTRLGEIDCDVALFLHEITHSAGVLLTDDHRFRYIVPGLDVLPIRDLKRDSTTVIDSTDSRVELELTAYGLELCLALIRRDERDNTNKAEGNADNWTYYFLIRMLILAYPEIDFLRPLETDDPFNLPHRKVWYRSGELLHHCTLFERLRSREPLPPMYQGGIRERHIYDPSKDYWSADSGRGEPRTMTDILEVLEKISNRRMKKSERNRKKKAVRKANGKLRKKKAKKSSLSRELWNKINTVFDYLGKVWKR